MASKSSQSVYTFSDVSLVVGARKCLVSSGVIQLMENAIPTATFPIDPVHTPSQPTNVATAPTLADISQWHDYYSKLAVLRTPCTFTAKVTSVGGDIQSINLKDWILTGAGIKSASAGGSMSLELELQHPICLCQDASLAMPYVPFAEIFTADSSANYTDLVDAIANIALNYSTAKLSASLKDTSIGGCSSDVGVLQPLQAVTFLQSKLAGAARDFMANIEWLNPSAGWPLQTCLAAYIGAVKYTLIEYFTTGRTNNLWELLIRTIVPDFMVSVVPSITGKLGLQPFQPWLKPNITLIDEDITSLTFPGTDPAPVVGVTVADMQLSNTRIYYPNRMREYSEVGVTFAPLVVIQAPASYRGTILQMNIPSWLVAAQNRAASGEGVNSSAAQLSKKGCFTSPADIVAGARAPSQNSGSSNSAPSALWTSAAFAYAKACFYQTFRQSVQVGVQTRFMIKSGAVNYIPCQSCSVVSVNGKVAFDFYITSVVHSFSCADGSAGTEIAGTHARPRTGFPGVVDPDTHNPLYV